MLTGVFSFSYLPSPLTTKPNFCMKHDVAGTSWESWPPSCICSTVSKRRAASFERMYVVPTLEFNRLFETRLKPVSVCVDVLKISFTTSRADSTLQLRPEDPSSPGRAARCVVYAAVRTVALTANFAHRNRLADTALPALFPKQRYLSICPSIAASPSKPNVVDISLGLR
jgi:hypothetical protein